MLLMEVTGNLLQVKYLNKEEIPVLLFIVGYSIPQKC